MFQARRLPHLVLILSLALPVSVACAKGKAQEKPFDFVKTNSLMREMETRPDFPVGTVLANDYVRTLVTLGQKIDTANHNAIVSYQKVSQQKDGSFVSDKSSMTGNVLFTDISLDTLSLLGASNAVDLGKAKAFAAGLKNPDGGFGFSSASKRSSLANTYYAVRVLKRLNALEMVDKVKTAAYVKQYQKKEGGFGAVKGAGAPSARDTFMASYTLDVLGALDEATRKNAVKYLTGTPYGGSKHKQMPDLDEELYAVLALKQLKAARQIDRAYAMSFMKKIYIKPNGGFGPLPGYGSSPDSTTTALRILAELGQVKTVPQISAQKRSTGHPLHSHPATSTGHAVPAGASHPASDTGHAKPAGAQ